MATRRRSIILPAVLWLLWLGLLAMVILLYNDTRLSYRANLPYLSRFRMGFPHTGFPYMPLYGAVVWWFFVTIPLIGWTWGYFNDLKSKGLDARYDRYRVDGARYRADD